MLFCERNFSLIYSLYRNNSGTARPPNERSSRIGKHRTLRRCKALLPHRSCRIWSTENQTYVHLRTFLPRVWTVRSIFIPARRKCKYSKCAVLSQKTLFRALQGKIKGLNAIAKNLIAKLKAKTLYFKDKICYNISVKTFTRFFVKTGDIFNGE